jgi:hypothetical protein
MIKLCVAAVAVLIAPLLVWLMVPTLMFLTAVALFMVPLASVIVACTRPHSAIQAPAMSAMQALPEREATSERGLRPSFS